MPPAAAAVFSFSPSLPSPLIVLLLRPSPSSTLILPPAAPAPSPVLQIAMEYCDAGSVQDVIKIRKRQLSEEQIAAICAQVVRALVYLHSKHVMHRDIKSGNILLTEKGEAKLGMLFLQAFACTASYTQVSSFFPFAFFFSFSHPAQRTLACQPSCRTPWPRRTRSSAHPTGWRPSSSAHLHRHRTKWPHLLRVAALLAAVLGERVFYWPCTAGSSRPRPMRDTI